MRRIDCHMHFWTLAMEPYYALWMSPDDHILYRDYGPHDAFPLMDERHVEGTVLVAAASSINEAGYLLGMADGHDRIKGVVAWLDLLAPSAPQDLAAWARFEKLKGVRPYLQDIADDTWILQAALDPAIQSIRELGLRFDALIKPRHILNTVKFIERYPDLPIIIDHMAKPAIESGEFDRWHRDMKEFAGISHVHCKVSGILTEDGPQWSIARAQPYFDAVLDIFGADRLVFGSDWPVVNLRSGYVGWIDALGTLMARLSDADQQKIWATNGERFYGLGV